MYLFKKNYSYINFLLLFIVCFIILFLRRTDALLNPQFWAEDGVVFYAQAYNVGILKSFTIIHVGYLHTLPRLMAGASQFIPLSYAPLLFNLVAIIFQIIPVLMFCSQRFKPIVPSLKLRLLISGIYLALPNSFEIHGNLTNTHWFLTFICFLILLTPSIYGKKALVCDAIMFLLTGLSTISSVSILPLILAKYLIFNNKAITTYFGISLFTSVIQLSCLFTSKTRSSSNLWQSLNLDHLVKLIADNVFLPSLIGLKKTNSLLRLSESNLNHTYWNLITYSVFFLGIVWLLYCLFKAKKELIFLILFSAIIIFMSIFSALSPSWETAILPGEGNRYYFYATITFIVTWVWGLFGQKKYLIKCISFAMLSIIFLMGITGDFTHNPYTDLKFSDYAQKFNETPSGTILKIPINPPGWEMELIKH